jgi:prepilin-type N-terminal cleavage/methylation domain-containing protein
MTTRSLSLSHRRSRGFTLVELMITVMLLAVVVISLTTVMYSASRSKTVSANNIEASEAGRVAVDMLARDLRSAGYGADLDYAAQPQTPLAYIDSMQVLINENLEPWPDTTGGGHGSPLAYNPAGSPQPWPLAGTSWTPPIRYLSGAEIVRWTLDLNNDGAVDATDQAAADAVDAQRTPNPDDFELVRQVYGDSTNNAAGNNGPVTQRVALVRRPGSGVPPMFTVYMKGSATPWNWSSGPVPAGQLADVERVAVQITAPSGKRDWLGHYAESNYRTEANLLRNTPQSGADEYTVDGYVYLDSVVVNRDRDPGERGLAGAVIRIGTLSTTTSAAGYYSLHVPAGTYYVKQATPPAGYVNTSVPESLSVTVPPAAQRSFPDAAIAGAFISAFVFEDLDNDGVHDAGETGKQNARVTVRPGGRSGYTDASGNISPPLFASVGACSVSVTPPDSFVATTTNPLPLTIVDHVDQSCTFGVFKPVIGTVRGTVFRDTDRDGVLDVGDQGMQNVWVGVTTDGGITVPGYAWTDASGNYSIDVPANDPPHTVPYTIMAIPPNGFFPTSATAINGIYLQAGQTLSNQNFGVASFTVITLQANRVLCLGSADLVESDWNGNHTENAHGDADLILGSDTGGSDQVSVWFNQYDSTPLFDAAPTYTRSAPGAVVSMALDYFNTDSPLNRPDLVTGCKTAAAGNFFVWWCQNSSGNQGTFPSSYSLAYRTTDNGDVQAVVGLDCAGGAGADLPDLIVGTKSPTAYQGSFELWTNSNAASPTFSRTETYPTSGGLPAGSLGEVTAIVLGDFDGDGRKDLAVGARTALGGQVCFFRNMGKTASPHFSHQGTVSLAGDAVTALVATDVNGDGLIDVVAGTQTTSSGGRLTFLKNWGTGWVFDISRTVDAPGIVTSLAAADLGGSVRSDLAVGWRQGTTGFVGGARIYYLDAGTIPPLGLDPSAGTLANWVPAVTTNNYNYGTNPAASPPYMKDLAVGAKVSATTGALVVFVR